MSSDDGVMFVQVPLATAGDEAFKKWMQRLAEQGVNARLYESAPHLELFQTKPELKEMILRIEKSAQSPASLPR